MADATRSDSISETSSIIDADVSETNSLSEHDAALTNNDEGSALEGSPAAVQAAKAIEAAQDSTPDVTQHTPVAGPSTIRVPVFADEQTPLLDAGPAPPDYAAATAWRRSSAATSNDNRPSEVAEESLYESGNIVSNVSPPEYFGRFAPSRKRSRRANAFRKGLCFTLFVILIFAVITPLQIRANWPEKVRERIVELDHANTEACHFDRYSEYATFSFEDPSEFHFKDTGDYSIEANEEEFPVAVRSGDVNLYAAPKQQQAAVEVWVSVATTNPWEVARLRFVEGWNSLAMVTPLIRKSKRPDTQSPKQCVHTWVGIFVHSNVTLDLLKISAGFMNVSLGYLDPVWIHHRKDQNMRFSNITVITDKFGRINAHYLNAQQTRLKTLSGNITGIYTLRDELLVESSDGAADITVDPAPDGTYPGAPPWFNVRTNWSPLGFFWPILHPPEIAKNDSGFVIETGYGLWDGLTPMSYIKMNTKKLSIVM